MTGERAVETLTRYLRLCDEPSPERTESALGALFTEDAIWEGTGAEYAQRFGSTQGRDAIVKMLFGYQSAENPLVRNVHLLFPGRVAVSGDTAEGSWQMQQLSSYADGRAEVMVARLDVEFRTAGPDALISRFGTCRLFRAELGG
ncbi:nuclear transport factor 2 family protein [Amycolatopsis jejuensis]|uniref:nuclear transport factor 2 family protein n=1 Tax=Amycolatopsis jejuensis TaxID=330084 RepID=UPI00052761EC|nr:nuclear transport factor 2 family protein [Amycolatopsis jejuensis]